MTSPDLSRRGAMAVQVVDLPRDVRSRVVTAIEGADTFDQLGEEDQRLIEQLEGMWASGTEWSSLVEPHDPSLIETPVPVVDSTADMLGGLMASLGVTAAIDPADIVRDDHGRFATKGTTVADTPTADLVHGVFAGEHVTEGRNLPPEGLPYDIGVPRPVTMVAQHADSARTYLNDAFDAMLFDNPDLESSITREQFHSDAVSMLDGMRSSGDIVVRAPWDAAASVAEQGIFKSQHESGDSQGSYNPPIREAIEAAQMGVPFTLPIEQRPIYGTIEQFGDYEGDYAAQYGDVQFILGDAVKSRSTMTFGDTLDDGVVPVPMIGKVSDDQLLAAAGGDALNSVASAVVQSATDDIMTDGGDTGYYREAQIHGGLTTASVVSVIVPYGSMSDTADTYPSQTPSGEWEQRVPVEVIATMKDAGLNVQEAM